MIKASVICGWTALLVLTNATRADEVATTAADAAEKNDADALRALIEQGAEINGQQIDGTTALHWVVYHDDEQLTEVLIQAGADVKAVNRYGVPPLSLACKNGNRKIVQMLLDAGAEANTTLPGGETALMTASRTGQVGPVKALLSGGAEVNAREHQGQTALMWAAAEGNLKVVEALLQADADYRTPLSSGFTPLFFAVREGHTAVALRLLEAGLDVDDMLLGEGQKDGPNPLLLAVENGHFETAVALLEAGADPNAQPEGHAALHAMSRVRKPIRGDGNPPPIGSGQVSDLEFIRKLIAAGADVNLRLAKGKSGFADFTTTGSTLFVLASRTGDLPLMKLLLEAGCDPSIGNADNCTPLLAASGVGDLGSGLQSAGTESEAIEAFKLLLELGADINAVDENGETAMHGAAYQNWPELVEFLAANGAEVSIWNRKNRWGWTPLLIAHGYRKGNFRPDADTIAAIQHVMQAAGVTPPVPGPDVVANQQSWDKKKRDWNKEKRSYPSAKQESISDAEEKEQPSTAKDLPKDSDSP